MSWIGPKPIPPQTKTSNPYASLKETMKLDPKTNLLVDLTPEDKSHIVRTCKDLILKGTVPHPLPEFMQLYLDAFQVKPEMTLLSLGTVIPNYALLSLELDSPPTE